MNYPAKLGAVSVLCLKKPFQPERRPVNQRQTSSALFLLRHTIEFIKQRPYADFSVIQGNMQDGLADNVVAFFVILVQHGSSPVAQGQSF